MLKATLEEGGDQFPPNLPKETGKPFLLKKKIKPEIL